MAVDSKGVGSTSSPLSQGRKRALLDYSDSESGDEEGGVSLEKDGFKVNEEYARRFEHNKKREEMHRLEEKFKREGEAKNEENGDSSSDETEDDDGFLATEDLDAQISATLQALKSKDPRVYNKDTKFYREEDDDDDAGIEGKKPVSGPGEKPVFLRDYHRAKIMRGDAGASDDEDEAPPTYTQEQAMLKKSIMQEINAAEHDGNDDDEEEDAFLKQKKARTGRPLDSRAQMSKLTERDVVMADKDPETYLSNFLSARAWVSEDGPKWQAFESDDEDDGGKADEFEEAYNLRFENPEKSNEVLRSYARDITNARSVRRQEKTGRKRQRELEKERKEEEKQARRAEKMRLRKLKLEEAGGKLQKIKQAAGALGNDLTDEDLMKFLDDAWENDAWEQEMQKRFGDGYYATQDGDFDAEEDDESNARKKRAKKPKWDDDIDIKDIVPDFEDEHDRPAIALSDEGEGEGGGEGEGEGGGEEEVEGDGDGDGGGEGDGEDGKDAAAASKKRKNRDRKRERLAKRKQNRQEHSQLEAFVDSKLQLTNHDLLAPQQQASSSGFSRGDDQNKHRDTTQPFRYRETSPQSFGMTARDILLAPSDKALNEFAGLKKLATFRDVEKKKKDRKRIGKKARLRQWRRDNFGAEFEKTGPTYGFERVSVAHGEDGEAGEEERSRSDWPRKRSKME